jgi:hypothetical protein
MVSLWWVAAAFLVGDYAGAVLVGVLSMARHETDDTCQQGRPVQRALLLAPCLFRNSPLLLSNNVSPRNGVKR